MPSHASSYIKTTAAAVARVRDQLSFPFTAKPQPMTVYVRFVESGDTLADGYVVHIGDATTYFHIRNVFGLYTATLANGITSVLNQNVAATPTLGQIVELSASINTNGSLTLRASINGGAETTGGPGVNTRILPSAWGAQTIWFNSRSTTNVGFLAVRNVQVQRGVFDLNQMRAYAGA